MNWQIAIDGPAAAGKSTIAKIIAKNLGFEYLDTGAMYRAATVKALRLGIDIYDESQYDYILSTAIDFIDGEIYLDGENVNEEIRTLEVSNNVSVVCKWKIVRDRMVELQQKIAESKKTLYRVEDFDIFGSISDNSSKYSFPQGLSITHLAPTVCSRRSLPPCRATMCSPGIIRTAPCFPGRPFLWTIMAASSAVCI